MPSPLHDGQVINSDLDFITPTPLHLGHLLGDIANLRATRARRSITRLDSLSVRLKLCLRAACMASQFSSVFDELSSENLAKPNR